MKILIKFTIFLFLSYATIRTFKEADYTLANINNNPDIKTDSWLSVLFAISVSLILILFLLNFIFKIKNEERKRCQVPFIK